jgi:hypothetical protein
MNAVVKNLILNGAKTMGKDANGILSFIEEQLTPAEYKEVKAFLNWSFDNDKPFGWGNLDQRLAEFKSTKKR